MSERRCCAPLLAPGDASIVIVGLVRDGERTVERSIRALERAFAGARRLSFLVVESDSRDRTVARLRALEAAMADVRVLSLGTLRERFPARTQRLAHCRNVAIAEVLANPCFADVDYVVVADLDGVNDSLTADAVATCWAAGADWDVCCANQRTAYYDVWALRHPLWCPTDCWQQSRFLESHGVSRFAAVRSAVFSRMVVIPSQAPWIAVQSAFGGCAIYRRPVLAGASYSGLNEQGAEVCEHVPFHQQIGAGGGRIVINPALLNGPNREHTWRITPAGIALFWLRCQLRRLRLGGRRP